MSTHFPDSTLEEIRDRVDIVELIGQYVQLKKTGKNYSGLCPFHKEKSASFSVEPNKQFFYCFACSKGGNIFTFLTQFEGISFPEAVRRLAKRAGVEIKEEAFVKRSNGQRTEDHSRVYAVLELAAKYYQHLLTEKKEYRLALDYIQARGISRKTIDLFRIGVSPQGYQGFQEIAHKRGFTNAELISAGLFIEKPDHAKGGYDRFRFRLMFPLINKEGNVIGFGARILEDNKDQPKYLNSSDSPVFSKRRNLYGLFENQRGIRLKDEAVVVEGYMDVVGLYEAGVQNAVASMGTALTEEHLREIRSLTRNIVTVFDPDAAGEQAFQRSISLCMQEGFFAKNLELPEELDPDEYVRKEGAEAFYALTEKAPTQMAHFLKDIAKRGSLSAAETESALKTLMPILLASRRQPGRALLWDDISLVLKVSVAALKELTEQEVQRLGRTTSGSQGSNPVRPAAPPVKRPVGKTVTDVLDHEFILATLLAPEKFLALDETEWKEAIKEPEALECLKQFKAASDPENLEKTAESWVHASPNSSVSKTIVAGLFADAEKLKTGPSFDAVLDRLRKRKKELRIKTLTAEVRLAQRTGNGEEQLRLLKELQDLRTSL